MQLNYDVKEIYKWPLPMQVGILAMFSLILIYLFYLFDITDMRLRLNTSRAQENVLKQKIQTLLEDQYMVKNGMSQMPLLQKKLEEWQTKFVDGNSLPAFLDQIVSLGSSIHVKFNLFEPSNEKKVDLYYKVPVKVNILGTFDQIGRFISQVVNMPKIAIIDSFNITIPTKDNKEPISLLKSNDLLQADLTIDVYRR